jgi:parallel beta-helix repeat protein
MVVRIAPPVEAKVLLCGTQIVEPISGDPKIYQLIGDVECKNYDILSIDENEDGAYFDLREFKAKGDGAHKGIVIKSSNVKIDGGVITGCTTALSVDRKNDCEIKSFKAIKSTGKAFTIRGNNNTIIGSLCIEAADDCFELRENNAGDRNTILRSTSINAGTGPGGGQGIQFRGSGNAIGCSVIGGSREGFQIQASFEGVTIKNCIAMNNARQGIWIEGCSGGTAGAVKNYIISNWVLENKGPGIQLGGSNTKECAGAKDNEIKFNMVLNNDMNGIFVEGEATDNTIMYNIAFKNGSEEETFDLYDGNYNCDDNLWKKNAFETSSNLGEKKCIH